jgi:hypothetical protein
MRDPATVKRVADRVKTYSFIDDVRYGEEWIEKLYGCGTSRASRPRARARVRRGLGDHHRRDDPHGGARAGEGDLDHAPRRRDGRLHPPPFLVEGFAKG